MTFTFSNLMIFDVRNSIIDVISNAFSKMSNFFSTKNAHFFIYASSDHIGDNDNHDKYMIMKKMKKIMLLLLCC